MGPTSSDESQFKCYSNLRENAIGQRAWRHHNEMFYGGCHATDVEQDDAECVINAEAVTPPRSDNDRGLSHEIFYQQHSCCLLTRTFQIYK